MTPTRVRAPEFPSNKTWLNTNHPLSIKELRGRFLILDFWTYCCINCLHILPDLQYLEEKYADSLTVIGVHSAKFDHEKEIENIRQAILRYDVKHPVVVDNDFRIWNEYDVRAWPTLVLVNPKGYYLHRISGEGHRENLDSLLNELIQEYKSQGELNLSSLTLTLEQEEYPLTNPLAFPGKVLANSIEQCLFIADSGHHRLVISDLNGKIISIVGNGTAGLTNGSFQEAQFSSPQGMVFDVASQMLYVADTGNHVIRKVDLQKQEVTTIAGTGKKSYSLAPHAGRGLEVALNSPWDVEKIGEILYIAMAGSHQIWSLDLASGRLQTYTGTGIEACFNGTLKEASFAQPSGVTTNGQELFVADSEVSSIRGVSLLEMPTVRTVCGSGDLFGFGDKDGEGFDVRLQHCLGIHFAQNYIWVADTYNHKIKQIDPKTGKCQTVIGDGVVGDRDSKGTFARLFEPSGLSATESFLYIADTNNHAIRQVDLNSFEVKRLEFPDLCAPNICISNENK